MSFYTLENRKEDFPIFAKSARFAKKKKWCRKNIVPSCRKTADARFHGICMSRHFLSPAVLMYCCILSVRARY